MYQQYFGLHTLPFSLTPDTRFFCESASHVDALNMMHACLKQGEGFIKLVGEIGSGKTLLCRRLLQALAGEDFITAYIPNPNIGAHELPRLLAKELGLEISTYQTSALQEQLLAHLLRLDQQNKTVVVIIDEAQAIPDETLEALRLLTNLETETHKLLQIVLLGQPELDIKLAKYSLRQLQQRIGFSYYLKPFTFTQTAAYIQHRLVIAGRTYGTLFTHKALQDIHKHSQGLPRVINILAHKALMVAYGHHIAQANRQCVKRAIRDTPSHQWVLRDSLWSRCWACLSRWNIGVGNKT